eukprot:2593806-Rhodomonas_salina.1
MLDRHNGSDADWLLFRSLTWLCCCHRRRCHWRLNAFVSTLSHRSQIIVLSRCGICKRGIDRGVEGFYGYLSEKAALRSLRMSSLASAFGFLVGTFTDGTPGFSLVVVRVSGGLETRSYVIAHVTGALVGLYGVHAS